MNALVNEVRGTLTGSSFIIGGVMEDQNGKYMSIYNFDSEANQQRAFYYKRKDGGNEKSVTIAIQGLEVDYQDDYIFACYNAEDPTIHKNVRLGYMFQPVASSSTLQNLEFKLPTGDDATCIGMNYVGAKINPPDVFEHISIAQYPNTAQNIYTSVAFNKNIRMRYVIGTMPGRVNPSQIASVIFSLDNDDECFAPQNLSQASIPFTFIYEQIVTDMPLFIFDLINQASSTKYFEEQKNIVVKNDLRLYCFQEIKETMTFMPNSYQYSIYHDRLLITYLGINSTLLHTCGTFHHQIKLKQNNLDPPFFISVNQSTFQLTIKSIDVNDIGNYTLVVTLYFDNNLINNQPTKYIGEFEIQLNVNKFNNAPYFQTKQLENQIAISGQQKTYNLPDILDWEEDRYLIILESKDLEIFTNLIDKKLVFSPQNKDVGVYKVKIKVADINDQSLSNTYTFKLTVQKGEPNQQIQNPEINGIQVPSSVLYNSESDTWSESATSMYSGDDKIIKQYLQVKIASISSTGEMTLLFDSQMKIPNKYSFTLNDSLAILLFDQLRVTFVKNLFYKDFQNDKVLPKRYQISKTVPPQIDKVASAYSSYGIYLKDFNSLLICL
eukprot:403335099